MSDIAAIVENPLTQDESGLFGDTIYPPEDKNPPEVKPEPNSAIPIKGLNSNRYLVPQLRKYQFTTETAKAAALASVEARRVKANPPPPLPAQPDENALLTLKRLQQLSKQIGRTLEVLDEDEDEIVCPHCKKLVETRMSPKDRAQLLNALDRLLERERILRGIAAPAPFRAPRQTRQSSQSNIEPL